MLSKKESKKFCEFLKLVKEWHRTKSDDGKTGQQILQIAWNNIKKNDK